jgi:hypothetical protein
MREAEKVTLTSMRLSFLWRTWMRQKMKMEVMWRDSEIRNMKKYR